MMLINVIFRLLNFGILSGLFYYVIKQFLIPFVVKMMMDYDAFIGKLTSYTHNISQDSKALIEQTNDQELQFQVMQSNFLLWQEKCHQKKQALMYEQEQIEHAIKNRFDIRSKVVLNELVIKEQLPYILDRVTVTLQKKYIEELIHVMKEQS